VVVAVAALVLLSGAAAVVAAAGRHHRGAQLRAAATSTTTTSTTTTSTADTTTTTVDLVPSTTPTTAARPTTTSASTTTTMPLPVVTSTGAVLQAPTTATTRTMTGTDCTTLAAAHAQGVACGVAHAKGGPLVWLVEGSAAGAHARHVYVFAPGATSTTWKSVLEAVDFDGSKWQAAAAAVAQLTGDGTEDIAFGFRAATGGSLAVDVVAGPGTVTAHRDLPDGAARVSSGQWDTWATSATAAGQDDHDVIRWDGAAWRVVLRSQVAAGDVPPSQF